MQNNTFREDVIAGLSAYPKRLQSKYFYDGLGDGLFGEIMSCPEYYLTRAEEEILREQAGALAALINAHTQSAEVIELGAGDASKTIYLLRELVAAGNGCTYFPIDISSGVIADLEVRLPHLVPELTVQGFNGEYLPMLREVYKKQSGIPKAVLFMGGNIGNMQPEEAEDFCTQLRQIIPAGDLLLIGFDLVKDPRKILAAYNDAGGLTRDFNLNLLRRINTDLGGNFNLEQFYHYPTYDPDTGACKSFLVSTCRQEVALKDTSETFYFEEGETLFTEISQKYQRKEIKALAGKTGFEVVGSFLDQKAQFAMSAWRG